MTPKEKAIELHNKILNVTYDDRDIPGEPTWVSTKCALIAVEFAREQFNKYCLVEVVDDDHFDVLRQEIEKL